MMERVISTEDFEHYTYLKQILSDLDLTDKDFWWLISDLEAYPQKKEYEELLYRDSCLLIKNSELVQMLNEDDFQWVWGVFSAIPSKYSKEEILEYDLPCLQIIDEGNYNPCSDEPRLQHPLAEFELYAVDSTDMFVIASGDLIKRFKKSYPKYKSKY